MSAVDDVFEERTMGLLAEVLPLALPTVTPAANARSRLLELVGGRLRFAPFAMRVARLFDVDRAEAEASLERITEDSAWIEGPVPGFFLSPMVVGPALSGASGAFIRARVGVQFPRHRHIGEETVLVLQGLFQDSDAPPARPGDYVRKPDGSSHDFTVGDGPDCVCAYLTLGGIEL